VARGDEVVPVSRRGGTVAGADGVAWDPVAAPAPLDLSGADAVVNMAGEPLLGRWTAAKKRRIRDSRVITTARLVDAMRGEARPLTLLNASGVGYYGPVAHPVDESAPPGDDFLAHTCVAWEGEALRAEDLGVRVVLLRTGIVLAREGGVLPTLLRPARLGVGGPLGGGRQWFPWIHIDDEAGLVLHALDTFEVRGPLNAAAPAPVRQREMASALGRAVRRPAVLPAPGFAVRLIAGEMATLALDGQNVVPAKALATGYRFAHTAVDGALADLLR
jgi:uncharacterized protein